MFFPRSLVAAALSLGCLSAFAAPIPASAGSPVFLNFELGKTFPVRSFFELLVAVRSVEDGELGRLSLFDGLDGSGTLLSAIAIRADVDTGFAGALSPGMADGQFSLRAEMTKGAATFDAKLYLGSDVYSPTVSSVPEPASVVLAGLALAGLAAVRVRRSV